jgi:uncharacterized integral membrane protein
MKKLQILKAILDFTWFFSSIASIGLLIFLPFYLFSSDMDLPVTINGQEIVPNNLLSKLMIFATVISGLLFLFTIYLLRKVVGYFQKREVFNPHVIKHFNLIGKLIIVSSLISNSSLFIFNIINQHYITLSLGFGSYDSFLISISLGLFFMVISEIFKIAKNMKEENELTI